VQKLHDATVAAMNMPAVRQRLKDTGNDVVAPERRSPAYLQKLVESEIAKWAAPIKTAGVAVSDRKSINRVWRISHVQGDRRRKVRCDRRAAQQTKPAVSPEGRGGLLVANPLCRQSV
jgi:hypothetical protein